jgi:uncharacterized protein (TIGR03382 family)
MRTPLLLPGLLLALAVPAVATSPVAVRVPLPTLPATAALATPVVQEAARRLLLDDRWLDVDAAFAPADDVRVRAVRFGGDEPHVVVRATPVVLGHPVEGADRILVVDEAGVRSVQGTGRSLAPLGTFVVAAHEATATAFAAVAGAVVKDATVERVDGFARAVWRAVDAGLVPAWRVRVPTWRLEDLADVWVDARTGAVLQRMPVARFGAPATTPAPTAARVFEYAPDAAGIDEADIASVDLADLVPAAVGSPLQGFHFETANCCKQVVCLDGGTTCLDTLPVTEPVDSVARCATAADIEDAVPTVPATLSTALPVDQLPIPPNVAGFIQGGPCPFDAAEECLFLKSAFCAELPIALSAADGWNFTPVDAAARAGRKPCVGAVAGDTRPADPQGCAAEVDAFSEVTVYHATQTFFTHVRDVLDDDAFCLGGLSQQCEADGTSTLDVDGQPVRPFHIATNVLFPQFDQQALFGQLTAGKGSSAGNPIVIDDFQRLPNAAFVPAQEGGPVQVPAELAVFARLFVRPFDSNVYFQGDRDFSYDGDVTRHEFTHAIVHSFNPGLFSLGRDSWGSHAESGGLNEGWSDYFSSSFVDDPAVGDYAGQGLPGAETGLRNNDNDRKCPDDVIGQVHNDSEPWTGALWAIRKKVVADGGDVKLLDKALLEAMALADDDEDMARATSRAIDAVRAAFGDGTADFAAGEFADRGLVACARLWPLSTSDGTSFDVNPMATVFQPGADEVGLANFAPSVMQFRVEVPAGSAGFTLTWQAAAGGVFGGSPPALSVLVHEVTGAEGEGRVHWEYEGAGNNVAVPYDDDGVAIDFDETAAVATVGAANQNTGVADASFTTTLTSDGCNARAFVVALVAPEGGGQLANVTVENIDAEAVCDDGDGGEGEGEGDADAAIGCACSGVGSPASASLFAVALLALRRRRRR